MGCVCPLYRCRGVPPLCPPPLMRALINAFGGRIPPHKKEAMFMHLIGGYRTC